MKIVLDPSADYSYKQILISSHYPVLQQYIKEVIIYFIAVKKACCLKSNDTRGIEQVERKKGR